MQRHNRRNSGQVLIIIALIVTLLLLSTSLFVVESLRDELVYQQGSSQTFSFYEQGIKHTVISALANASSGGDSTILFEDLNRFETVAANHSYNSILQMATTPINSTPYQNGIWIDWSSNGKGVTSACVNYSLDSSETSSTYNSENLINVTTGIELNGFYRIIAGSTKQVNLTCSVSNEGNPALAKNFTVYYERDGSLLTEEWRQVSSPNITDFGNGTYSMSFTISTLTPTDSVLISVKCLET